jgi:PIN domain nuclease of toxin-antitoxin system
MNMVQREAHGIDRLDIEEPAALHVARLPELHAGPFDRMPVAQALVGGLVVVTPDEAIRRYPARTLW